MGPRGQKNENFEKTFSKSKRASKFEYKTCATLPEREKKIFKLFVMDDARRIVEESFFKGVNGAPNTKKIYFFIIFWLKRYQWSTICIKIMYCK